MVVRIYGSGKSPATRTEAEPDTIPVFPGHVHLSLRTLHTSKVPILDLL